MTELFTRNGTAQAANGKTLAGKPLHIHGTACGRCGGKGGGDQWKHTGWTCYQCGGSGKGPTAEDKLYTVEELAKLNATAAKKAATKMAKIARERAARVAVTEAAIIARAEELKTNPLFLRLQAFAIGNDFLADLAAKMQAYPLSEAQGAAATTAMDRIDAAAASRFIGEVGQRVTVTGTVEFVRCIHEAEGYWDRSKYLIKIRTDDGQLVTWFTSSLTGAEGEHLTGTATVKDHSEFRGERQTVITRPRWKEAA